jgi:tRNA threonylcarbamoyladenosine biosynthesis protein TsaE
MNTDYTLIQIDEIAKQLLEIAEHKIFLFYGSMGVGKTTLIKAIAEQLGVLDSVSSPTFSLVNEYRDNQNKPVYHFDFYRIEQEEEALDMGIEEYFDNNAFCLIEWPEKIKNLLPLDAVSVHLTELADGTRHISTQ